jgi:hypothetical protein
MERSNVETVIVAGKIRKWKGRLLGVNLNQLRTSSRIRATTSSTRRACRKTCSANRCRSDASGAAAGALIMTRTGDDAPELPIKLDSTSNGEFAPVPLDAAARHARALALEAVGEGARRLGQSRRSYLVSLLGAAASLGAFNRAFAAAGRQGGSYAVPEEARFELAAAHEALAGDEFIFDVQLHHVNPQGAWRQRASPDAFRSMPKAGCGLADPIECLSSGALLKDVFMDSDTAMGVLSHVPGGLDTNPLDFEAAGATRDSANALDGTERLLLHGRCMPTLAGELEGMDAQAARFKPAAFKTYTQFGPPGGPAGFFLDDERHGRPFINKARALGVKNIAVHKGLAFGQRGYEFSTSRDIGPAARPASDMTFLIYHAGFDTSVKEGPYDPNARAGVDVLVRSMLDAGKPGNVYAELGSTWRFVMRNPEQAAHLLGKLLKTFGEDRVLWGTDSIWYGSPQDQIQAFPRLPDQPRVPGEVRLPGADAGVEAQGVRPQRSPRLRPQARRVAPAAGQGPGAEEEGRVPERPAAELRDLRPAQPPGVPRACAGSRAASPDSQGTPGVSTCSIARRICGRRSVAVRRPHSTIVSAIAKLKPSPTGIGTVSDRSARPAWLAESHQPCSR